MLISSIPISDLTVFSKIDRDLNQIPSPFAPFLKFPAPNPDFEEVAKFRLPGLNRELLHSVLKKQYLKFSPSHSVLDNVQQLLNDQTFTVCTAHQPSLFLGPAFVLSKAISTIKLANSINDEFPHLKIIPVFVLGSEDHDFDELNHTFINGQKITWQTEQTGPVGRFKLDNIAPCIEEASRLLQNSPYGHELISMLTKAYTLYSNFADAFHYLLNELLGEYGLVVLNQDDPELKKAFIPHLKNELFHSKSKEIVPQTQEKIKSLGYQVPSFVREINLFYLGESKREKIEKIEDSYHVPGMDLHFDRHSLEKVIEESPEYFSPNVVMRPLYQESVLPNLAYVGGGGELAYWMERKEQFEAFGIAYPVLVRRDSFMIIEKEQLNILSKFNLSPGELLKDTDILMNRLTNELSQDELSLSAETEEITAAMDQIKIKGQKVDATLAPSIEGEKIKILKSLEHIEKKILKAEKLKLDVQLNKIKKLKDKLMPEGGLQERRENFMTFYAQYGKIFIQTLLNDFNPLDRKFKIIEVN